MDDTIEVKVFKNGTEQKDRSFAEPGLMEEVEKDLDKKFQQKGCKQLGPLSLRASRPLHPGTIFPILLQGLG